MKGTVRRAASKNSRNQGESSENTFQNRYRCPVFWIRIRMGSAYDGCLEPDPGGFEERKHATKRLVIRHKKYLKQLY
jgi:hypothetical protein